MPRESDLPPVPNGPWVFETPHVAALMDVGQARIVLEDEAKALGNYRFGQGYHDFIAGEPLTQEVVASSVPLVMNQDPTAWSSILRASLITAQGSDTLQELKDNVKHLAVLALAWYEEIEARTVIGIDK